MIFRYPGGKSKKSVKEKIMAYFPAKYEEFREPMVGGGGIFFSISLNISRWINDIDGNLISLYTSLRDRPIDFISLCRKIKPPCDGEELDSARPGGKKIYSKRLKEFFDKCAADDDIDQALRYFFVHRTVWGGRVNYDIASRMYFSNPNGWNMAHSNRMEEVAKILNGVRITSVSYENLLVEPGNDVLIYLDPPYNCERKTPPF